jgi:hypothetical protein
LLAAATSEEKEGEIFAQQFSQFIFAKLEISAQNGVPPTRTHLSKKEKLAKQWVVEVPVSKKWDTGWGILVPCPLLFYQPRRPVLRVH